MNYGEIKTFDIANGLGVRVSLFVSGCSNHCKGCFQPETWNFNYGNPYTKETEDEIFKALQPPYIQGLSLLGGDPFELANQPEVTRLVKRIKKELPNKDIWAYTGYILDQDLLDGGRLGGDPFELANQPEVTRLVKRIKKELPNKDIWAYTGYILDQDLLDGGRMHTPYTDDLLECIDVLVDGPFVESLKDLSLKFCGSSNQRLIDLPASLKAKEVILFDPSFIVEE